MVHYRKDYQVLVDRCSYECNQAEHKSTLSCAFKVQPQSSLYGALKFEGSVGWGCVVKARSEVCDGHRAQISAVGGIRNLIMMSRQQSWGRTFCALRMLAGRKASSKQTKYRNDATWVL